MRRVRCDLPPPQIPAPTTIFEVPFFPFDIDILAPIAGRVTDSSRLCYAHARAWGNPPPPPPNRMIVSSAIDDQLALPPSVLPPSSVRRRLERGGGGNFTAMSVWPVVWALGARGRGDRRLPWWRKQFDPVGATLRKAYAAVLYWARNYSL